jgi:2-iminobutanoate/2-iminopropanoate deaminase
MPTTRNIITVPQPGLDLGQVYGYPQSVAVEAGGLIFCSGMIAVDPLSGERQQGTVTSETRRIFENLRLILDSCGSGLHRIVHIHAMIYSRIEYEVLNRIYRQYLVEAPPARTVCEVVIESGMKVQLDVTAAAGR